MAEFRRYIDAVGYVEPDDEKLTRRVRRVATDLSTRRSLRKFSGRQVPREALEQLVRAAASAPSGANQQPWHFVVITGPELKRTIRIAAEKEEREFYDKRAPAEWRRALAPIGTDANKAFLEDAAALVVVFVETWGRDESGAKRKHYHARESVGLATGLLVGAAHLTGLGSLTYTPSPMGFLSEVLERPDNEVPYMVIALGFPAADATVPVLERKALGSIVSFADDPAAVRR